MPNWCNNNIIIEGPTDTIIDIWKEFKETGKLLSTLLPESPKDDSGSSLWSRDIGYNDLYLKDIGNGLNTIEGYFESAWCSPYIIFNEFCKNEKDISIRSFYYEEGMNYAGWSLDGICKDYYLDEIKPDNIKSSFPNQYLNEFGIIDFFEDYWEQLKEYEDEAA